MTPTPTPRQATRLTKRILLVDDDADTLSSIGEALRVLAGAQVVTATSGAEALAKFDQARPEALVTDYSMPDMDGLALTKAARRRNRKLPVVMITAFNSDELAREAATAGVCEVLPKPTALGDLVDAITDCCTAAQG